MLWVARDKDNKLSLFTEKPKRHKTAWYSEGEEMYLLDDVLFPNLKFGDEPIEVELKLTINEINKRCY